MTILSLTLLAFAQADPDEFEDDPDRGSVDGSGEVVQAVGAMRGESVITDGGFITFTDVKLRPAYQLGELTVGIPVDVSHRQTVGFSLPETGGSVALKAKLNVGTGWVRLQGGAYGFHRNDWPDPYQPDGPNGELLPTDRRSYFGPRLRAEGGYRITDELRIVVEYQRRWYDYRDDPKFDPVAAPTHLQPGDHTRHMGDAYVRFERDDFRVEIGLNAMKKSYGAMLSRDAGTGKTNGLTDTPNPLYAVRDLEPRLIVRVPVAQAPVVVGLEYRYEIVEDLYQGYYSFRGHVPELRIDVETGDLELTLKASLTQRTYGPGSYAEGGSHIPLDYGTVRADRRVAASVEGAYSLNGSWALIAEGDLLKRDTNFPDYEPGVFPSSNSRYTADFDYLNWQAIGGARFAF